MTGKEAIIEKIISDARKIANSTNEEGAAKAQDTVNRAENDAKIYRMKNRDESSIERDDIVKRRITAANLEVKKLTLAAKQKLLGAAFASSVNAIKSDASYPEYLTKLLRFAEDGDVVIVAASDKKILTEKAVADYAKKNGIKLTYRTSDEFGGGIILSGAVSDKNFTLEVEVEAVRDEIEPIIAKSLFGDK